MDLSSLIPKGWEQSERWGARWTGENLWDERIKKLICVMYLPVSVVPYLRYCTPRCDRNPHSSGNSDGIRSGQFTVVGREPP